MVCCCNTIGNIFRLIIVGGCAFALAMQILNIYSCEFITVDDGSIHVGIWYQGTNGECNTEPGASYSAEEDSLVAWARTSLLVSMIAGFIAGTLVLFEWLCCEVCCAGCIEGGAFIVAWACGLGVYMIYGVDGCGKVGDEIGDDMFSNAAENIIPDSIINIPTGAGCEWGTGATFNLLACISYFGAGVLLCFAPQPKPICKQISD